MFTTNRNKKCLPQKQKAFFIIEHCNTIKAQQRELQVAT